MIQTVDTVLSVTLGDANRIDQNSRKILVDIRKILGRC